MASWWETHLNTKSDAIAKMVSDSPESFMISRTEILQLVLDFKMLKNKLRNLCLWQDASEEFDALPEDAQEKRRHQLQQVEAEFKKIFNSEG